MNGRMGFPARYFLLVIGYNTSKRFWEVMIMVVIEEDTIKLLRECDAGIKMGVEAIDEVIQYVNSP